MQKISPELMKRLDEIARLFNLPTSTDVTAMKSLPTLFELMEEEEKSPTSQAPARARGLFAEILQDDPTALYQDMRNEPEKYDPDAVQLVTELVAHRRKPKQEERLLLDRAVLDLNSRPPPRQQEKKPVIKLVVVEEMEAEPESSDNLPVAGVDFPEGLSRPFWWL